MRCLCLLFTILLCSATRYVVAESYHVSANDPDASDDNIGAFDRPWATISRAADVANPGDVVIIHAGVYREQVRPKRSGTQSQPICFAAADGDQVVISGADVITDWEPAADGIWKKRDWCYQFRTHPNDDFHRLIGRCEQVVVDGSLLTQVATMDDMRSNTFCAATDEETLYVRLSGDADPNEHLVEASIRTQCFGLGYSDDGIDHIQLRGLTIRHAANTAQNGALYAKGNDWLVEDCTIEWTNGTGVAFRGDDITLRRVRSHHNGQQGARGYGRGFLLEEVVLDHNNLKGFDQGWEAGAIKISRARDGIVRRCRAEFNKGNGFWFDIDVRDVLVEDCVARDNARNGIFVEISGGFVIRNNLCVRNGLDGKWGRGGIGIAESDDCLVERNTCMENANGIAIREQGPRKFPDMDGVPVSYHVHDLVIRDNVCASNTEYQVGYWYDNPFFGPHSSSDQDAKQQAYDPDKMAIRLEHNLYWWKSPQRLAVLGVPWRPKHKKYDELAKWQQDRDQDRWSIVADPDSLREPAQFGSSLSLQESDSQYRPNNTIILACDRNDGSHLHVQNIHTTIEPQQRFVKRDGKWIGVEPDWEGESYNVQTHYLPAWSIEVHYNDDGVDAQGTWKHSRLTGSDYAVFVGKHVPAGLSLPIGYATRDEPGCMLSRKFDPDRDAVNFPGHEWHTQDWDFVEAKMTSILNSKGIRQPWKLHRRRTLVSTLANWIKDTRLQTHAVEKNLHPVDFLDGESGYCGGAANTLVAMCSILQIPARYIGTWDHGLVEYQDDDETWRLVENQPDVFLTQTEQDDGAKQADGDDEKSRLRQARSINAVYDVGLIDVLANPAALGQPELPKLGWYYNWSCPFVYDEQGVRKDADLYCRPQSLHDWVFNLYTGYGGYESKYIHRRGFFMAERFNSVYELAALYSPRRQDLPYVCAKRDKDNNIIYLTPFRDSYYQDWDNKTRIDSGPGNAVRQQFYLSDLDGVSKVIAAIMLGPDGRVDHLIPADGGDWYYEVNGNRYPLKSHGGFNVEPNYNGTGMTVHKFEIVRSDLKFADQL
ncbi:right-handed parallel beta-helix repeat-containing protein [Novipirellula herctigrandis]